MVDTSPGPTALPISWLVIGVIALLVAAVVSVSVGAAGLSINGIVAEMLDRLPWIDIESGLSGTDSSVLWQVRLPRIALGALVGGMLALAGTSYQGIFRNPLADPYLLGVAAGAGLGATLAIVYGPQTGGASIAIVAPAAFAGALIAALGSYLLGTVGRATTITLILAGVAVAAFLTAIQTYVQLRNTDSLREVFSWMLGRISTAGWREVRAILPLVVISCIVIFLYRRLLDVLALGDEEATTLGIKVTTVRLVVLVAASLGTAAVVAVSGLIGFVGIIVPHALRLVIGTSYVRLVPLSFLAGATFLVFADLVGRTIISPAELPIGVVTAFIGAPFFLAILLRSERTSA
ncbi:MAG: iron ABC transporter permease [Acidimicrobiia bacterium]|nr:MAG: iron ABC transporter permease [Acidimicrobiia bacterium]